VFRKALRSSVIRLRVIRRLLPVAPMQTQTVTELGNSTNATVENTRNRTQSSDVKLGVSGPPDHQNTAATPAMKIPPAVPPRSTSTSLSRAKNKFTQISSTRLIGKVMNVELAKGE